MNMTTFGAPIDPKAAEKATASKKPNFIRAFYGLENAHMVLVKGDNLIAKKIVNLAGEMIRSLGIINTLVFRNDGYPKNLYGTSDLDAGTIVLNLEHHWEACIEIAQQKDCFLSIPALWTIHILNCIAHEMDHLTFSGLDRKDYEQMPQPEREERACKHALAYVEELATQYDMEPGQLHTDPMLYIKMTQLFQTRGNEPWVIRQRKLLEDALIFSDPDMPQTRCTKLHDWFQMRATKPDGPEWRQPTFPVSIVFHEDHPGQMAVFSPQGQPAAIEAVVQPVVLAPAAAITVPQPATVMAITTEVAPMEQQTYYDDDYPSPDAEPIMACGSTAPAPAPSAYVPPPAGVPTMSMIPIMNKQVAQVAGYQAAAAGPYKKKVQKMFAPNNYSDEQIQAFVGAVYERLHAAIFTKCEWQPNGTFTNAAGIIEGVRIDDLETAMGVKGIIAEYDTVDAEGRYAPGVKCDGHVRGQIFSKTKMPGYTLYLNLRGFGTKRVVTPQNPNTASDNAGKARNGMAITYVINGDKEDADKSKWVARFENDKRVS